MGKTKKNAAFWHKVVKLFVKMCAQVARRCCSRCEQPSATTNFDTCVCYEDVVLCCLCVCVRECVCVCNDVWQHLQLFL